MSKKAILIILVFLEVSLLQNSIAQKFDDKFTKIKELGGIEEYQYEPNGMNLLLVRDNSAPVVTVQIVYRVGSRHEVTGNTGSTHLLEHLMFKGTEKFNKRKGTSIDSKLNRIGAQMNATTWNDRTNYYETIPSDKIEVALEIEADRMRNSLLLKEDKEAEMTVVRNEFERGENNPNSVLSKEIWATAYMAHPYHHSTIGWRSDIEKMPIEVLRKFYNTYYWPNNATLTIIGDFEKETLFKLVDKHFGKITRAPHEMPQPYTEEPPQYGPRKVVVKKPGQLGVISVAFKIPGRMHQDLPALKVLGEIIGSGTSSVINTEFIDKGLAFYGYAYTSNFKEVGLFTMSLGVDQNSDFEGINKKMLETLEKIKTEGVQQKDVDRIVSKLNAQTILSRDGSGSIAKQLTEAIAAGDWTDFVKGSDRLKSVTAEQVQKVAKKYLLEDQSTTGYFIPKTSGANPVGSQLPANFTSTEWDKHYYRHPDYREMPESSFENQNVHSESKLQREASDRIKEETKTGQFVRETVAGMDVVTAKTGAKDFVTVAASFPIGSYFNSGGNKYVPLLTARLLSKGTTKKDKFQFSQQLEKLGVSINVNAGTHKVDIGFKCLEKDLETVVSLLAEELRYPLFDAKELEILKQQILGNMQQGISDPATRANIALSQLIYPADHPNYSKDIEVSMEDIKNIDTVQIRQFHKNYFGPKGMRLVAVGDVDTDALHIALKKSFFGWKGGINSDVVYREPQKNKGDMKVVSIPQKPSAQLLIGQYTGLKRTDPDYLPFFVGNYTLGGGFSGRLMRTVRDEDGLTYSIGTKHTGHDFGVGGNWSLSASFSPKLFQKGLDATMIQLKRWWKDGITEKELQDRKSNLTGKFKVGLSSTTGLAGAILTFLERGLQPDYVNQYPKDIEAVTLDQVNQAIKKYIDLNKLIVVKSGSLDKNGAPMDQQ
nr:pitrilysin family protein [Allomuricauda sp.]